MAETDIPALEEQYALRRVTYLSYADRLEKLMTELLKAQALEVVQIESRAKDVPSFLRKVEENPGKYPSPFEQIHDMAGVRIIAYYLSDVPVIDAIVEREFEVDSENSWKSGDRVDADRFGYASDHYVVSISTPRADLAEWQPFAGLKAEIQVRTVLQHAWAAIDHKLAYKRSQDIPAEIRRGLSRVSALLEVADEQFEAARSASARLDANYGSRAKEGDLGLPIDLAAVGAYVGNSELVQEFESIAEKSGFILEEEHPRDGVAELTQASRLAGFVFVSDLNDFLEGAKAWANQVLPVMRKSSDENIPWRMSTAVILATLVLIGRECDLEEFRETSASADFFIDGLRGARQHLADAP
jgi:putative GTP pyrophosphokinase